MSFSNAFLNDHQLIFHHIQGRIIIYYGLHLRQFLILDLGQINTYSFLGGQITLMQCIKIRNEHMATDAIPEINLGVILQTLFQDLTSFRS